MEEENKKQIKKTIETVAKQIDEEKETVEVSC